MSIYGELRPMPEHRTQFAFKGKKEQGGQWDLISLKSMNCTGTFLGLDLYLKNNGF